MLRIYKSSAGSGKTFTLVKEYLRLALAGDMNKYKHILAITFTNKAANEMKNRIILALQELAAGAADSAMARELLPALNVTPTVLKDRAEFLLQDILHHYSDLSVSTIDSFVHRLIRSFAYDLHISSNFEIEMDSNMLLTMAVEKLLDSAREEEASQVTKALIDFAENNLVEGKGWSVEYALINFSKELFNEDSYKYIEKLSTFELDDFIKARDGLYVVKTKFESQIKAPASLAFDLIKSNGLDESHFFQTRSSIYKYFLNICTDCAGAKLEPNSYVGKTINEGKWTSGKITDSDKAKVESIKHDLTKHYHNIQAVRGHSEATYLLAKLLLKNIYAFMLLTEIKRMLDEYKKENNILHISEFQERISHIVREQDAPIIYERIGDWYDCILIDEFQDTSVLQWRNLLPLVENSQMKVQDSLIVGDGKQAIYRFRGGEVEQFAALPLVYKSEEDFMLQAREVAIMNYGTEELALDKNYRSRKEIIDFNNSFYEIIASQPEFAHKHIYQGHAQAQGRDTAGGYVSIDFLECEDKEQYTEALCTHVEALIHSVRDKGYAWRDIAILTRTNDIGSDIASFLLQQGIPVVSSESLLIGRSHEVRAIISFLHYISDKDNLIRRMEVLYYCAPDKTNDDGGEIYTRLRGDYATFEKYISELTNTSFNSDELIQNRLPELIQSLIRKFTFLNKDDSFIQFFMDEILEYSVKNGNRINEFLDWWEVNRFKKSIIYPDSMDAVRVLTIHKAKGLQYPVVIIPDADFKLRNTKRFLWSEMDHDFLGNVSVFPLPVQTDLESTEYGHLYQKEMADSLLDMVNLLYVATTRPEERLYLISEKPANEPEKLNSITALLVKFIKASGLWNGFIPYEFGDDSTSRDTSKIRKESINEFAYTPVINKDQKQLSIRRSSELKWNKDGASPNLLRQVLSEIKYTSDARSVVDKYYQDGNLNADEKKLLIKDVEHIINSPAIAHLFANTNVVYLKRRIADGKYSYTVDRLVIDKKTNKASIVNYRLSGDNRDDENQINRLAGFLAGEAYTEIEKWIIYTDTKVIVRIP
jgi:ATP-dependent exoDNAse (exonuclease V) beta subunit